MHEYLQIGMHAHIKYTYMHAYIHVRTELRTLSNLAETIIKSTRQTAATVTYGTCADVQHAMVGAVCADMFQSLAFLMLQES